MGYDSDQSRYGWYLDLALPLSLLGGFQTTSNYHTDYYDEPSTTEQQTSTQRYDTRWNRQLGERGRFNLNLRRTTNTTERSGSPASESENTSFDTSLNGKGELGGGVKHAFLVKGEISERSASSGLRAGSTDQRMNMGTGALGLSRGFGDLQVGVSAGVDAAAGPQTLGATASGEDALTDTKTTVGDTLGVQLKWDGGGHQNLSVKVRREAFREERLDYAKDERGISLNDPETGLRIVDQEEEVRDVTRVELAGEARPLPPLRVKGRYSHERRETQYELSQQGFVPERANLFSGDASYRYAQAGSLKVSLSLSERWDDRRSPGAQELRGKHFSVANDVAFTLDQRMLAATDLRLHYSQSLTQQVYDYDLDLGTRDQDILNDQFEARVTSTAIEGLDVRVTGSLKKTSNIAIDAEEVVSNNREQAVWKVAGEYDWAPLPSVTFSQGYQLSIDYTDYHYSYLEEGRPEDSYYKRTQLQTQLALFLPFKSRFRLMHILDRTRGGIKEVVRGFEPAGYNDDPSRRQDEHRVTAAMTVPVRGLTFSLETQKTYRTRGTQDTEYLGDIHAEVRGQRSFLGDRLQVNLDLGYVWAYGPPRVIRYDRDEGYLTARSHVVWTF